MIYLERLGRLPALRGDPLDDRHRRARAGVGRARDDRLRHQRRGARHHRRARRLHGAGAARQRPRERQPAAALPRQHGRGSRPGRGPPALAAHRRSWWRRATSASGPPAPRTQAVPWAVLLFGVIGGTAGLYLGLRERWWETRLLTFSGGWVLLAAASERLAPHWPVVLAALVLSAPVWWHAPPVAEGVPAPARAAGARARAGRSGEALYFFTTPLLLGWALYGLAPDRFDATPGPPAAAHRRSLPAGRATCGPRPAFALVGAAAAAIAVGAQWDGLEQVWALARRSRCSGRRSTTGSAGPTAAGTACSRWPPRCSTCFEGRRPRATAPGRRPSSGRGRSRSGAPIAATAALAGGLLRAEPQREEARTVRFGPLGRGRR